MHTLLSDARYAVRALARARGLILVSTLSLGLGIGATTAVFSAVDGILLSASPYSNAGRLFVIKVTDGSRPPNPIVLSPRNFIDVLAAKSVEDGIMWDQTPIIATGDDVPVSLSGGKLSPNAFAFFGVPPLLGRTFTGSFADVFSPPDRVVVLSYGYWRGRLGGADVLGQTIELDRQPYTIIGVMPERFRFLNSDIYVPMTQPESPSLSLIRLKRGVSVEAARQELHAIDRQRQRTKAPDQPSLTLSLASLREDTTGHLTRVLGILSGAVGLLLVIACVNVTMLLVSRGMTRAHELSLRSALGASSARIIRQLLTEALMLSAVGGVVGIAIGYGLLEFILTRVPRGLLPADTVVHVDQRVLLFSLLAAAVSGLAAGVLPAIRLSRASSLTPHFAGRTLVTGARPPMLQRILLPSQIALTVLLIAGSAAAWRTYVALTATPLGYQPAGVQTVGVQLAEGERQEWAARVAYYEQLRASVQAIPGVEAVAVSMFSGPPTVFDRGTISIPGRTFAAPQQVVTQVVSEEYFTVLGIPLRNGRIWTHGETARARRLAVINEAMARRYWPDADPMGQRLYLSSLRPFSPYQEDSPGNDGTAEIVGVVGDVRNAGLQQDPLPQIYTPYTILAWDGITLSLRTATAAPISETVLRKAVASVNRSQAVFDISSLEERLRNAGWGRQQFVASLFLVCALFALLLATIGLYSVVTYAVSRRAREFALRNALGATRAQIASLVFSSIGGTVTLGLAVGVALTAVLNRPIAAWTESTIWHLSTLVPAVGLFSVVGACAVFIPARRAMSEDPMTLLRAE